MKITGSIKVSATALVDAPSRKTGEAQRFGVGEQIKLAPLQSLPGTGTGVWSIRSGGGKLENDGASSATYTARDLSGEEWSQGKKSYDVLLELLLKGEQLATVTFTVIAPESAWLLKLGDRHQTGSANAGFWGIWVLGPNDVSFMNAVIKESRGTINATGVMEREAGTIHKITGGVSHTDDSGAWLDALVMTDKGTAFAAVDNVWTPAATPSGGWQPGNTLTIATLTWDIAQMYKLKSDPGTTGLQYAKAWHKSQATAAGVVTTEKGGAKSTRAITDPTTNFTAMPPKASWPADIPQAIKDKV